MTTNNGDQPTPRDILDAVLRSQDVLAAAVGRIDLDMQVVKADLGSVKADVGTLKGDVAVLKGDVAVLKGDVARLERRAIRIDDRLAIIENLDVRRQLDDHEHRLARLERP